MTRVTLGRIAFASLLVVCIAVGQAVTGAQTDKPSADKKEPAAQSPAKTPATTAKAEEKKPAATARVEEKKPADEKKSDDKTAAASKDAPAKEASKEAAAKPTTLKLKKGPFRVEVSLDGVFEAQNQAELFIRPQEWVLFTVLKAVDHGATVKQGDLVLALDTEKIDRVIADLRMELQVNELAVKLATSQAAAIDKLAPLDEAAIVRARRITEEDWKHYQEVDKPLTVKLTEFHLKQAQESLEYAEEEYRQLEKMYKADDLLEETEKIVLRRAKNGVDRAKLGLELAQASYDEARKLTLPRQEARTKDLTDRALIEAEFAKANLPVLMGKHHLELEKLQVARAQGEEKLRKLLADRDAMILKSPIDGVVYYGRCVRGKWSAMSVETLRRGAMVTPNDVVMTVVQVRPVTIRTTVPESQVQRIHAGLNAWVQPVGFVGQKISAVVQRVGTFPMGSSGFDCQLTVASEGLSSAIVPGMNCELKMIPYKKADALTIPSKAAFTDEFDPAKQ
jgi:HlyD family secretion protein